MGRSYFVPLLPLLPSVQIFFVFFRPIIFAAFVYRLALGPVVC
jgi:hypothetical protein